MSLEGLFAETSDEKVSKFPDSIILVPGEGSGPEVGLRITSNMLCHVKRSCGDRRPYFGGWPVRATLGITACASWGVFGVDQSRLRVWLSDRLPKWTWMEHSQLRFYSAWLSTKPQLFSLAIPLKHCQRGQRLPMLNRPQVTEDGKENLSLAGSKQLSPSRPGCLMVTGAALATPFCMTLGPVQYWHTLSPK